MFLVTSVCFSLLSCLLASCHASTPLSPCRCCRSMWDGGVERDVTGRIGHTTRRMPKNGMSHVASCFFCFFFLFFLFFLFFQAGARRQGPQSVEEGSPECIMCHERNGRCVSVRVPVCMCIMSLSYHIIRPSSCRFSLHKSSSEPTMVCCAVYPFIDVKHDVDVPFHSLALYLSLG